MLRRACSYRTQGLHPSTLPRPFTTTSPATYPRKHAQDRDSLKPESTEYSKSGTDDAAAQNPDAAFNPKKTRPEEETAAAGEGGEGNPLDVSPGNEKVSRPRGSEEGGAQKGVRKGASGGGSAPKAGGGKSG
jgi:hypothetical protein